MIEHGQEKITEFIELYNSFTEKEKIEFSRLFFNETKSKISLQNNPTPVSVVLLPVNFGDKFGLLGFQKSSTSGVSLPSSFIDFMEDANFAATRELRSEVGIETDSENYTVFGTPGLSTSNNLLIYVLYKYAIEINIDELNKRLADSGKSLSVMLLTPEIQVSFPMYQEKIFEFFKKVEQDE